MSDYNLCWFCDGEGHDGSEMWPCRICKGAGVAERWIMEAESMVVGWSECFANAGEFYDREYAACAKAGTA